MRSNTYCSSTLDEFYSTKMDAWISCDLMQQKQNNCTAINDHHCDDDKYKICKEESTIEQSSKGSCTYFKQGNINSKYVLTIPRLYKILLNYITLNLYTLYLFPTSRGWSTRIRNIYNKNSGRYGSCNFF